MSPIAVFSPAKLNLFLAITGRRPDGFHDLVSVVATLDFGDTLAVEPDRPGRFTLQCDRGDVPLDETNLVLRAARAFASRTGWTGGARFTLQKRIPLGAGLGGGSSNAVAALRALNALADHVLDEPTLGTVAAELGSDCPLFLHDGPVVIRGRGERVEALPAEAVARLAGRRVLVFKPAFAVNTTWAYRHLAARATTARSSDAPGYLPATEAEARLAGWLNEPAAPAEALVYNNFEPVVFEKFVALPTLLDQLQQRQGWAARMSGSGSACFGFVTEETAIETLTREIQDAWGVTAFLATARLAGPLALNPG